MSLMASLGYTEIILSTIFFLFLYTFLNTKRGQPINWPFLGMIPSVALNFHRIHQFFTEILEQSGGTIMLRGVWFSNTNKIITCDPINAHYVLSEKFANFEKGVEAKKIFDVHGDLLFNADHDEWRRDRKIVRAFFNDRRTIHATVKLVNDNLEKGLIPVFEHAIEQGIAVDMQDLFKRLMLDSTSTLVTGYNPGTLSLDYPEIPLAIAMDVAGARVLRRHFIPGTMWKLQKWLNIGGEKKMSQAKKVLDDTAKEFITKKGEDIKENVEGFDALRFFMTEDEVSGLKAQPYKVLRDIVVILNAGGRDTTSSGLTWLFWRLSKDPSIQSKIRKELESILPTTESNKLAIFNIEEVNKLPYLHAAFLETLRLYPSAPVQQRVAIEPDVLPTGHRITPKMEIMFSWYALGRMKSIWGDDCLEFNPDRWLSENGEIKFDLVKKYLYSFSAGPRVCPGKTDALTRMKAVAAFVIHNYNVQVEKGSSDELGPALGLKLSHGLMAKISKRFN